MTDAVDRQLRALMARLHEMTPLPPTFDDFTVAPEPPVSVRDGGRRRLAWAVSAATVVVVIGGAGVFVATRDDDGSRVTGQATPLSAASGTSLNPGDVVGLWVFASRAVQVDANRVGTGWPMPSPLPAYRYEPDGTVRGFDGCNETTRGWELANGRLQAPPAPNNTGAATAALCVDSAGNPPLTVSAVPNAVSVRGGIVTLQHLNADGSTARGVRVDDLPSPAALADTSWFLAVDGDDVTISFGSNGTVELKTDVTICATGRYRFTDRVVEIELSAPQPGCADRQLSVLTSGPLAAVWYSPGPLLPGPRRRDREGDDTLLLASERGAVRLFPSAGAAKAAEAG
jgi:hypothetical protein